MTYTLKTPPGAGNHRIQKSSSSGSLSSSLGGLGSLYDYPSAWPPTPPAPITPPDQTQVSSQASDGIADSVQTFSRSGSSITDWTISRSGSVSGAFIQGVPAFNWVATDRFGSVRVDDTRNNRIETFKPTQ